MAIRMATFKGTARAVAVPLVCLVVVVAAGLAVVILSRTVGGSDVPPPAPPFTRPATPATTVFDVKQRNGDQLTLMRQQDQTAIEQQFSITPDLIVEIMRPITEADIKPGDWLTVIGVPDDVKNYSIHTLVVFPAGTTTPFEGAARTKGGFLGHEANRTSGDRPIVGGVVEKVTGKDVTLTGPTGSIVVTVGPEAPAAAYLVESATPADIKEGYRLAGAFSGESAKSVLLFPPAP